jgi:hypothetical protein
MITRVADPFVAFRNLRASDAQYRDATRKPEEIYFNVFMAVRFDFQVKVTSQASSAQVSQAHLVAL